MPYTLSHLGKIRTELHTYATMRRELINSANTALHNVKRAIFAAHRGDVVEAKEKIVEVEKLLLTIQKTYKKHRDVLDEGAHRAALEEYVEAKLFVQFVANESFGKMGKIPVPNEIYIAGLCDVPGELYRYALRKATLKQDEEVTKAAELANAIMEELATFELTSYLRNKHDQAKGAFQKIEEVVYDISLR
jgi:translin